MRLVTAGDGVPFYKVMEPGDKLVIPSYVIDNNWKCPFKQNKNQCVFNGENNGYCFENDPLKIPVGCPLKVIHEEPSGDRVLSTMEMF